MASAPAAAGAQDGDSGGATGQTVASASPYTSTEVTLPMRVEELVRRYVERDRQCRELRDCVDYFYRETTRIAEANASSAEHVLQLRDILSHLSHAVAPSVTEGEGSRTANVTGDVRGAAGKGVAVVDAPSCPTLSHSNVRADDDNGDVVARTLGVLRAGDTAAYDQLRLRVLAMEAAGRLLQECRVELHTTTRMLSQARAEHRHAMAELGWVSKSLSAVTTATAQEAVTDSVPRQLARYAQRVASLQTELQQAQQRGDEAGYRAAQLENELETVRRERTFLHEKATQLEGQLHRLLSAERAMMPAAAPCATEVDALRATVARLNAEAKRRTHRSTKLEAAVTALTGECAELKSKVLQYQRQLNERELAAEREAAAREDAERARGLEHECALLRSTLHERNQRAQEERQALQHAMTALQRRERVYGRAVPGLLRRMAALQLDAVVRAANAELAPVDRAESAERVVQRGAAASTTCGPTESKSHDVDAGGTRVVGVDDASAPRTRSAELHQLQLVNKELRQALAQSREELQQKSSLLQRLMGTPGPRGGEGSGPGSLSPLHPTRVVMESSMSGSLETTPERSWDVVGHATAPQTPPVTDSRSVVALLPDTMAVGGTDGVGPARVVQSRRECDDGVGAESVQGAVVPRCDSASAVVDAETLVRRLTTAQTQKRALERHVEELERRCGAMQAELERNAATMNRLVVAGVFSPAAVTRGGAEGQLRGVQRLLQKTLEHNIALESELTRLRQDQSHR